MAANLLTETVSVSGDPEQGHSASLFKPLGAYES